MRRHLCAPHGHGFAVILHEGKLCHVPSFAVRTVDTTGAGHAFAAAFLQARLRGWPHAEAALAANAAGAAATATAGAGENVRTLRQIAHSVRTQPEANGGIPFDPESSAVQDVRICFTSPCCSTVRRRGIS